MSETMSEFNEPLRTGKMPIINSNQISLIVAPTTVYALATIAVALRISSRRVKKQEILTDDYLCVVGLILGYAQYATVFVMVFDGGLALPYNTLSMKTIRTMFQALLANYVIYIVSVAVVQISILLFYIRMFGIQRNFRYACYVVGGIVIGWAIAGFFTRIFGCGSDVEGSVVYINPTPPGHCANKQAICSSIAILHVIFDLTVLALPLPIIWKLQTTLGNKLVITCLFAAGLFATACAILRMQCMISLHDGPKDFTIEGAYSVLYQCLETPVGLICICIPTLAPMWTKLTNSRIASYARRMLSSGGKSMGDSHELSSNAHRFDKLEKPSRSATSTDSYGDQLPLQAPNGQNIEVKKSWTVERNRV